MRKTSSPAQSGNVLFLILIAVALFAALSYAVTQSTRSGGGDASKETNVTLGAAVIQSTAEISVAIQRMVASGVSLSDINVATPDLSSVMTDAEKRQSIFHPDGGGAIFPRIAGIEEIYLIGGYEVRNIGASSLPGDAGNEVLALFVFTSEGLCLSLNQRVGYGSGIPSIGGDIINEMTADGSSLQAWDESGSLGKTTIGASGGYGGLLGFGDYAGDATLSGRSAACFFDSAQERYAFYQTILER